MPYKQKTKNRRVGTKKNNKTKRSTTKTRRTRRNKIIKKVGGSTVTLKLGDCFKVVRDQPCWYKVDSKIGFTKDFRCSIKEPGAKITRYTDAMPESGTYIKVDCENGNPK